MILCILYTPTRSTYERVRATQNRAGQYRRIDAMVEQPLFVTRLAMGLRYFIKGGAMARADTASTQPMPYCDFWCFLGSEWEMDVH